MNIQWKNEKELIRHSVRRYGEERNNPVRDYSAVEKGSCPTLCMP